MFKRLKEAELKRWTNAKSTKTPSGNLNTPFIPRVLWGGEVELRAISFRGIHIAEA